MSFLIYICSKETVEKMGVVQLADCMMRLVTPLRELNLPHWLWERVSVCLPSKRIPMRH